MTFSVAHEVVIDDFERSNHRWHLDGWERRDSIAYEGRYCLAGSYANPPHHRFATASLDESWDLSLFDRATLAFWESHLLDLERGEKAALEISNDGGDSWDTLLVVRSVDQVWRRREIDLNDWCLGRSDPVRLRFTALTDSEGSPNRGWMLDSIALSVGNIVSDDFIAQSAQAGEWRFQITPNPSNETFLVTSRLPDAGRLRLYDLSGRLVMSRDVQCGETRVNISTTALSTGIYIARLEMGEQGAATQGRDSKVRPHPAQSTRDGADAKAQRLGRPGIPGRPFKIDLATVLVNPTSQTRR